MVSSAAASLIRDQGDRIKNYEDTGDNLALEGLVDAKDSAVNTYYAVQTTRRAAAFAARTAGRVSAFSQKVIAHVKDALSQVGGLASKAAAAAPIVLGAAAYISDLGCCVLDHADIFAQNRGYHTFQAVQILYKP